MKAKELDRKFDDPHEDILRYFDLPRVRRVAAATKRVNVDFPLWMVAALDSEAQRLGVTRQSAIKLWLAERLSADQRNRRAKSGQARRG